MKETININQYSTYKVLCSLYKPRSPQSILIVEDKDDTWFIRIIYYKTSSGDITYSSTIIKPDYESQLNHIKRSGYIEK